MRETKIKTANNPETEGNLQEGENFSISRTNLCESSLELGVNETTSSNLELDNNSTMVVKTEPQTLDIKTEADNTMAPSPSLLNGDDLKPSLFKGDFKTEFKPENKMNMNLPNGGINENLKPPTSDSLLPQNVTTSTPSSPKKESFPCENIGPSDSNEKSSVGAGVATSEAQYMQTQSKIHVFHTELANMAAEAVSKGHVPNIVQFHSNQPESKKIIQAHYQKYPFKMNQMQKTHIPAWLNNMKGMKGGPMKPQITPTGMMNAPNQDQPMPQGVMNPYGGPNPSGSMMCPRPNKPGSMMGSSPMSMMGPRPGMMMPGHPNMQASMTPIHPNAMNMNPRITGIKVPDEHLTPEQRHHREERLQDLNTLQCLLEPVLQSPSNENSPGNNKQTTPEAVQPTPVSSQTDGSPNISNACSMAQNQIPCPPLMPDCQGQIDNSGNLSQPRQSPCMGNVPSGMVASVVSPPCHTSVPSSLGSVANTSTTCTMPVGSSSSLPQSMPTTSQTMTMGPSPVSVMGSSPGLGPNPNMGPSPGMVPGPQVMSGPGMAMASQMMSQFGPMGSPHPGMMMGQGPMGGGMMMNPQSGVMGNGMNPGIPPGMRLMNPSNPMMMAGPNGPMSAMEWHRMAEMDMKRKKSSGHMVPDSPMGMVGPMGGPMMGNHMMSPMHSGMMPMRSMGHPGNRMQGPPPPYHGPGPRPVSNGPLSSPGSPQICSITSPRMPSSCSSANSMRLPNTGSGIDSPRPACSSNPATPAGSSAITSPSIPQKEQPPTPQSADMPFGRQLQSLQQKHQMGTMNSNNSTIRDLMAVPSPQQIQYCHPEGQELTIQKQPNTNMRDSDIILSPSLSMDTSSDTQPLGSKSSQPPTPQGGPTTPHTPLTAERYNGTPTPDRFTAPSPALLQTPHTPQNSQDKRFNGPSPQSQMSSNFSSNGQASASSNSCGPKTPILPDPSPKTPSSVSTLPNDGMRFSGTSPSGTSLQDPVSKFPSTTPSSTQSGQKMIGNFSPGKMPSLELPSDFTQPNIPLDPNPAVAGKGLDPISSMAQMSQQLTSGQSGSPPTSSASTPTLPTNVPMTGQPSLEQNMMGLPPVSSSPVMMGPIPSPVGGGPRGSSPGTMAMIPGNPKMIPPGSVLRQPHPNVSIGPFNGGNVQVTAKSTIHHYPTRPQSNNSTTSRGPPNLEFLPRFSAPGSMEKSVSPMFPNSTTPNSMCGGNVPMANMSMSGPFNSMNVPGGSMSSPGPMNVSGAMCSMSSQISCPSLPPGANNMTTMSGSTGPFPMTGPNGVVPGPNGPMAMGPNGPMPGMPGPMGPNGTMMGPNGPIMGHSGPIPMNPAMMSNGPMGPNGQMMGPRVMTPHMLRGPNPSNMMGHVPNDMYAMSGGPMGAGPGNGPGPNQMMGSSAPPGMYGPKGSPGLNMGSPMGAVGDTAQPLPPSMGQSGSYKNSHFMVPTTADPSYAVQFHNFQQQLYATNTRGGPHMGPMGNQGMIPGGPHGPVGPGGMPPVMGPQGFPYNPK